MWMRIVGQLRDVSVGAIYCIAAVGLVTWCPAQTASQAVKPGEVELSQSRVYVRVGKTGLGHEHAATAKLKASTLRLSTPEHGGDHGRLEFDMASFDADSDVARRYVGLEGSTDASTRKQVNVNLLGKEVLDVKRHPTAVFVAKQVHALSGKSSRGLSRVEISGAFTLHGQTRPLEFVADIEMVKGWQHVRGDFEILQSDYGIKPYSKMLGTIGVADRIKIFGDLYVAP